MEEWKDGRKEGRKDGWIKGMMKGKKEGRKDGWIGKVMKGFNTTRNTREYKGTQTATGPRIPAKVVCHNYSTLTT